MRQVLPAAFSLLVLLGAAVEVAMAGEGEFSQCLLCHGSNANGNNAIHAPKLSGVDSAYLVRQLRAFRSGLRGTHPDDVSGSEMRTIALQLPEESVTKAVAFIAGLKAKSPTITIQGDAKKGATLYAGCAACHGVRGEGDAALSVPALANSSDWYLVVQLNNYRNGLRGTDRSDTYGAQMRAAMPLLADAQSVVDVVAYINTMK